MPPGAKLDPTQRFSTRVDDYIKYRPTYPAAVIDVLVTHAGLRPESVVADVGAGTGISSRPFLAHGCAVYAVEPNAQMRAAAVHLLEGEYPRTFRHVDGRAEATTLPDRSVDLVVCAQSFHWFDRPRAAAEFKRIARPEAHVAIIFNERKATATPFLTGYEALLLRFGTDYQQVAHGSRAIDAMQLTELFGAPAVRYATPNRQVLDWQGMRGRLLSASYTPLPGQPGHEEIMAGLRSLFEQHQAHGVVEMLYETEIFVVALS